MSALALRLWSPALGASLARLALASGLSLGLALAGAQSLTQSLLPAYRAVFALVADDFELLALGPDQEGADRVLRATVMWKRAAVIGHQVVFPDARGTANASTLAIQGLYGAIVALIAAAAWPASGWRELWRRLLWLAPMLGALVLFDLPCVLAGELWQIARDLWMPDTFSPLIVWKDFLRGGGRYALGLAAAALAVYAAQPRARRAGA